MPTSSLHVRPDALVRFLSVTAVAILAASVAARFAALHVDDALLRKAADFLYVDNEENLPTAFAVLLLLASTALLALVARLERGRRGRWTWHWAALAAGFAAMTLDEAWSFHEKLIGPGRKLLGGGDALGIFYYAWVVFAIVLLVLLVPLFLRFVIELPQPTRNRFLLAGALFVGGSVGTELAAGAFNELHELGREGGYGPRHFQYSLIATVEEGLEFAGLILFIRALLLYVPVSFGELRIRIAGPPGDGMAGPLV